MTHGQLHSKLAAAGVNPAKYDLNGGIPVASEGIVLSHQGAKWEVKLFERGTWYTFEEFDDEGDACIKMLELLDDPFYRR